MSPRILWSAAIVLWLAAIGSGMALLADYESRPGVLAAAPEQWPTGSRIPRDGEQPTLVVFAHPRCPCTQATLHELAQIADADPSALTTWVVFYQPTDASSEWQDTVLSRQAKEIPGVHVLLDVDGTEAQRFGAVTSGQTLLYDAEGRLLFRGGITGARGHVGENAGRTAIETYLKSNTLPAAPTPVFGCPIAIEPASEPRN